MPKKDCRLSEVQFYVDGQAVESNVVGQDNRINVSLANKVTIGGLGHGPGKTPSASSFMFSMESSPLLGHSTKSPSGHVRYRRRSRGAGGIRKRKKMEKTMLTRIRVNMTRRRISRQASRILPGLLAYLAVCLPVFGAETPLPVAKNLSSHGVTQAQLDGLDAIMLQAIEQGQIKGCSFLVAHKGEIVYKKAHGAFTTDERVFLASVSKPFAASVSWPWLNRES